MRRLLLLAAPAVLLGTGCPATSTLQTARTIPKGSFRLGLGLELQTGAGRLARGQTLLSARYGLSDHLDVGAKLYFIGGMIDLKWQLLRSARVDAAVAPGIMLSHYNGGFSIGSYLDRPFFIGQIVEFHLPVLVGFNLQPWVTLIVGPRLTGRAVFDIRTGSDFALLGGGSLGIALRPREWLILMPEVSLQVHPGYRTSFLPHFALGVMFGGAEPPAASSDPTPEANETTGL